MPLTQASHPLPLAVETKNRYKIIIEDESRLENILQTSAPLYVYGVWILAAAIIFMGIGILIVGFTPVKTVLPGYLKDSERLATEEQHLRLDSLVAAYDANAMFMENIRNILQPSPAVAIKNDPAESTVRLSPDSLLPISKEEKRFSEMMREREKYSLNVIAPLAAESMLFIPVAEESIVSENSRENPVAEVILAKGSAVNSIADGKVVAFSSSPDSFEGNTIIIQHRKGFLSKISRLGTVLVKPGENVIAGQTIATSRNGRDVNANSVTVEMWHNGTKLIPYQYIGGDKDVKKRQPLIDEEVGRGRL